MSNQNGKYYLGIFEGHADPAVAIVRDGHVIAYAEEERHTRNKHAFGDYPTHALRYCLSVAGIDIAQVDAVGVNWDVDAYSNGRMHEFFEQLNVEFPVDDATKSWQHTMLARFNASNLERRHQLQWRRMFGDVEFPRLHAVPHHYVHAFQATRQSPFDRSLCITIDGSGDEHCTVLWKHEGTEIVPLRESKIPHSLGWFYAALTEYLGFKAYDGEYKVMGLAAYGRPNADLRGRLARVLYPADDGVEYRLDPRYIHYGTHSYSSRFTDELVETLGRVPRLEDQEIDRWHEDLAFETQRLLEETVERLVLWGVEQTGVANVCIGGGVALNIKMNSHLFKHPSIESVFAHPLCSDGGAAQGVALATCFQLANAPPELIDSVAYGYEATNQEIEQILELSRVSYERPDDVCEEAANDLVEGKIVAWYQGRMEAGPRALGNRSILADPRRIENRDKVNAIIKFREYWRPFCPSMTAEAADRYFDNYTEAPFMIIAFDANDRLKEDAPAIVHVDGTARVQMVRQDVNPRYHRLLRLFEERTSVPVLLNTSYNIKGEPIVCTPKDALRTFWSTGLDTLVIGDFVVRKPRGEVGAGS